MMTIRETNIMDEVSKELSRQRELWGEQNHPPVKWLSILIEEVGEAAKGNNDMEWMAYRHEMVQVAAVALAALACFDRGKWRE